jgi:hypothetical protein
MKMSKTETLIACVLGVAIGVAVAEAVFTLVAVLAVALVILTLVRGPLRVRWTRRGARTDIKIHGLALTVQTIKEKEKTS